jgi:2-keto-3-deoxy-6-phosphogluconate aldolase
MQALPQSGGPRGCPVNCGIRSKHNIAVLPGALTPTEVVTAWSGGATPLFGAEITNFVSTSFA